MLQMIQQVSDFISAVEPMLQGKLPMNRINPTLLWNISTHLPEGYELIASTRSDNIYLYYELVSVALIGNSHGIKSIVNVL
jgi:hypothetical protein